MIFTLFWKKAYFVSLRELQHVVIFVDWRRIYESYVFFSKLSNIYKKIFRRFRTFYKTSIKVIEPKHNIFWHFSSPKNPRSAHNSSVQLSNSHRTFIVELLRVLLPMRHSITDPLSFRDSCVFHLNSRHLHPWMSFPSGSDLGFPRSLAWNTKTMFYNGFEPTMTCNRTKLVRQMMNHRLSFFLSFASSSTSNVRAIFTFSFSAQRGRYRYSVPFSSNFRNAVQRALQTHKWLRSWSKESCAGMPPRYQWPQERSSILITMPPEPEPMQFFSRGTFKSNFGLRCVAEPMVALAICSFYFKECIILTLSDWVTRKLLRHSTSHTAYRQLNYYQYRQQGWMNTLPMGYAGPQTTRRWKNPRRATAKILYAAGEQFSAEPQALS